MLGHYGLSQIDGGKMGYYRKKILLKILTFQKTSPYEQKSSTLVKNRCGFQIQHKKLLKKCTFYIFLKSIFLTEMAKVGCSFGVYKAPTGHAGGGMQRQSVITSWLGSTCSFCFELKHESWDTLSFLILVVAQ